MLLSLKYNELQIVKHALQHYITRENASKKDIQQEERLLNKVIHEVEIEKEKHGIN